MIFWAPVAFLLLLSLIGILHSPNWPGELFLSLLPQIALASAILAFLLLGVARYIPAILALIISASCIWEAREQFFADKAIEFQSQYRIIWVNTFEQTVTIRKTFLLAENTNADIILMAECPRRRILIDNNIDFGLYRHSFGKVDGDAAAISVFSKEPIDNLRISNVEGRKSVLLDIALNGRTLKIGAVHPTIPITPRKTRERNAHIRRTASLMSEAPHALLIGDFNTTPWSQTLRTLKSDYKLTRATISGSSTWISRQPFLGLPIDHVYTRGIIAKANVSGGIGSDHFPLIVDIALSDNALSDMR